MRGRTQALVCGVVAVLTGLGLAAHIAVVGLANASQWAGVLGLGLTVVASVFTVMGTVRERRGNRTSPDPSGDRTKPVANDVTQATVNGVVVQVGDMEGNLRVESPGQAQGGGQDRPSRSGRAGDAPAAPGSGNTVSGSTVNGFVGQIGQMTGDVDVDR